MIQSIYSSVRLRLRMNGLTSSAFDNFTGVKQGEPLSPLLFLFFINDITEELRNSDGMDTCESVDINGLLIHLLLFADDTVLFGKTPTTLQYLLDKLMLYCKKWNIEVNTNKTQVVVFRRGWQPIEHTFYYDNKALDIVNSYVYLGMLLHYNGKFRQTQKRVSEQGNKALASLLNTIRKFYITVDQQCAMFDSLVSSVINYGSEIWGFHHAKDVETIHNKFCRFALKVRKNTPVSFVIGELGHLPMHIVRKQRILKYWLKIVINKPIFVYDVYKLLHNDANSGKTNWASNVRDLLFDLGFNNMWFDQDNIVDSFDILNTRLLDQFYQTRWSSVENTEKLHLYKTIKTDFCLEQYLIKGLNMTMLSQLRSGTLKLNIETGRYTNIPHAQRICTCCQMNVIENEYHFLLICPVYRHLRLKYLPKYYCSWPNKNKLCSLLKTNSRSLLYKLSCFLRDSWRLRSQLIT